MNREEFNQLDIKGQVNYFNEELKHENNNFNAICKQLGISKNTILNRFKVNWFEPSKAGQRIIRFSQQGEKNLTTENSEVGNPILDSENSLMKNKKKASDPKDIDLILKRIELLEQKVEILESQDLDFKKEHLSGDLRSDKNFINSYDNTITKTFKIDVEVYKELEKLFDKYKVYKRQDIVSSLLKYALDNIE